jgi:hypothetical protein
MSDNGEVMGAERETVIITDRMRACLERGTGTAGFGEDEAVEGFCRVWARFCCCLCIRLLGVSMVPHDGRVVVVIQAVA